jgi:group I intron endonuclease
MSEAVVYLISNTVTNAAYVGCTTNPKNRWGVHRSSLRKGTHANGAMQADWNAHGEGSFEFEILELVPSLDKTKEREAFWLEIVRALRPLYNPTSKPYNIVARLDRKSVTIDLSEEAQRLLRELAAKQGISMTAVLEILLRKEGKEQGIDREAGK